MFFVAVDRIDSCHFVLGQFKIEHGDILFLVFWITRTGNNRYAILQVPTQDNLCGRFAMHFGYFLKGFVGKHGSRPAPSPERIPAFDDYSVLVHELHYLLLLIIGVYLILRKHGFDVYFGQKFRHFLYFMVLRFCD